MDTNNVARARATRATSTLRRSGVHATLPAQPALSAEPVPCVDLRAMFAGRFRFAWDPSYTAERAERRSAAATWLTRIPCRFGFIALHGGRRLLAYTTTRRRALVALRCVTVHQEGEGEVLVTFDVADIDAVAHVLRARRPRQVSAATRARLSRQGFPHRGKIFGSRSDDDGPGEPRTPAKETLRYLAAETAPPQCPDAEPLSSDGRSVADDNADTRPPGSRVTEPAVTHPSKLKPEDIAHPPLGPISSAGCGQASTPRVRTAISAAARPSVERQRPAGGTVIISRMSVDRVGAEVEQLCEFLERLNEPGPYARPRLLERAEAI